MSVIIVRLYWQHDLDLISLGVQDGNKLGMIIRDALRAYVRGENYVIEPPSNDKPVRIDNMVTHFSLNPKTDKDVIEALSQIRTGYRNSAIEVYKYIFHIPLPISFYAFSPLILRLLLR